MLRLGWRTGAPGGRLQRPDTLIKIQQLTRLPVQHRVQFVEVKLPQVQLGPQPPDFGILLSKDGFQTVEMSSQDLFRLVAVKSVHILLVAAGPQNSLLRLRPLQPAGKLDAGHEPDALGYAMSDVGNPRDAEVWTLHMNHGADGNGAIQFQPEPAAGDVHAFGRRME